MYSHAGIIVGAVVSALFGLYIFVPEGGLRNSDYWPGVWQPLLWNASAVTQYSSSEQKEESQFPLPPSYEEEEVMDENQFQFIGPEDILKRLQALSDLHGPVIGPDIPPRVPLSRMLRLHQAVVETLSILWPQFITWLLPYLLDIVLAQKNCFLRKLQKPYQAGKHKNVEILAGQKSKASLDKAKNRDEDEQKRLTTPEQWEHERTETLGDAKANDDRVKEIMVEYLDKAKNRDEDEQKRPTTLEQWEHDRTESLGDAKANDDRVKEIMVEYLDKAKNRDEDEQKRPTTSEQSEHDRTESLGDAKANDERVKEIMVEGPNELPDSKGLPAKRRRPGRRNSKRDHKFEAEKRKRKQAEKKAALAGVAE